MIAVGVRRSIEALPVMLVSVSCMVADREGGGVVGCLVGEIRAKILGLFVVVFGEGMGERGWCVGDGSAWIENPSPVFW